MRSRRPGLSWSSGHSEGKSHGRNEARRALKPILDAKDDEIKRLIEQAKTLQAALLRALAPQPTEENEHD